MKRTSQFTELADHLWGRIERQVRASIKQEQFAGGTSPRAPADIAKE